MRTRVIREVDGVYDLLARQFSSQQSLYMTHIYIVPQALQGKHRSLTAHIAEGDVRLDAQDTPRVFGHGGVRWHGGRKQASASSARSHLRRSVNGYGAGR